MWKPVIRIVVIIVLLVAVVQAQAQRQYPPVIADYVPMPYKTPRITVFINKRVTANMLLDTGSTFGIIADNVVSLLGLKPVPVEPSDGPPLLLDGKKETEVKIDSIVWMKKILWDGSFTVLPEKRLNDLSGDKTVSGLLGRPHIREGALRIDPVNRKITVWPLGKLEADTLQSIGFEKATALPMGVDELYTIKIRINDMEEVELPLDTGAAKSTLPETLVKKLKLPVLLDDVYRPTLYGIIKTKNVLVHKIDIGGLILKDVNMNVAEKEHPGFFPKIGMDILSQFDVIFDEPGRKFYLNPIPAEKLAEPAKETKGTSPKPNGK